MIGFYYHCSLKNDQLSSLITQYYFWTHIYFLLSAKSLTWLTVFIHFHIWLFSSQFIISITNKITIINQTVDEQTNIQNNFLSFPFFIERSYKHWFIIYSIIKYLFYFLLDSNISDIIYHIFVTPKETLFKLLFVIHNTQNTFKKVILLFCLSLEQCYVLIP